MTRMVTVAGPPSCGKTSVVLRAIEALKPRGVRAGVVKFDCLSASDAPLYQAAGVPVVVGLSGNLCPDHFFVSNVEECLRWGEESRLDLLVVESAGLCNRCSPHVKDVLAVCVIDSLAGVNTPRKIGPMLKLADVVVITKGDIVSQPEREVLAFKARQANPRAAVLSVNGITGQGAHELAARLARAAEVEGFAGKRLRFSMPMALCSYCLGETQIGAQHQHGIVKKMKWELPPEPGPSHG